MVKRMLIDATHPEETRVVVVNGTRLEELDVETSTKRQLKGNIYLAKVVRVEPSLQAAFVEYGGNRHGFLAFSEIHPDYFQIPVADRQALLAAQRAEVMREATNDRDEAEAIGEGHLAAEAVAEQTDGSTVEDAPAEAGENGEAAEQAPRKRQVETVGGDDDAENERRRARLLRNYKIQEVVKRRQIMLVQVVKEERGNKGAALTTYLSLAGRYCVLMPNTARGGGVSRKIVSATDRRRLKSIANEMDIPDGMAVIIRTAGSERSKTEIKRDYEYLLRMWDSVRELTLKSSAPALVYEEASLIKRSIRDLYSRDIDEVLVDGDEGYRLAKDYMRMLTPSHAKKVQPYKDPVMPMFHRYQVEAQLDAMHSPVVQLKSGGYIVISQTEALVAIDVNSGRATKERHIEETALKTNMEAADEVARQLRLRDLAGLIVIDFIDMEENRNNHAVERRMKEALKNDRARIQVGKISAFGLLELSRQRLRPSLQETTFSPCPHCGGTGLVRSVESAAVHILRAIEEEGIRRRSSEITVYVPTAIALYILNQKRSALAAIEERYEFDVLLSGDDTLIPPAFRMDKVKAEFRPDEPPRAAISMDDAAHRPPAEPEPEEAEEEDDEDEEEAQPERSSRAREERGEEDPDSEAGRKRRRRRRRRRKPGDDRPEQDGEAVAGDEQPRAEGESSAEGEAESEDDEGDAEGEGEGTRTEGGDDDQPRKRRRGRRGGRRRRRRDGEGEGEGAEAGEGGETAGADGAEGEGVEGVTAPEAETVAAAPQDAAAEEAAAVVEEAAPAAEEKPKRKRAPAKKKAEAKPEGAAPEEAPATAEEKPKRKRAPAKKKVDAKAEAAPAEIAVIEAPVAESVVAEPEVVAAEPVAAAPEPVVVAEEPVIAVSAPAPQTEAEPPAPAKPPRKGWWNRLMS
ncbi:Rne/Rng family ribonuclease [Paramagnetospirillum magneticum]|uniref:Rne/Rng family ribonuclease n=1 Tax=Paramagnetospirillum magneticum TaxID=84159 RepID=UPI00030CA3E7|nr:ribonuclease E/G [Paramagnetospirillum magneticum]